MGEPRVVKVTAVIADFATDHTTGDNVGGLLTFAGLANTGKGVIVTDIMITNVAKLTIAGELWIFDGDPSSGSTITDNAAISIAAAHASKLRRIIPVAATDWIDCGGFTAACPSFDKFSLNPGGLGNTIYAVYVARGTMNLTAADNIGVGIGVDA